MSVINKMLRDLDQRQAGGAASQAGPGARVVRGTVPLAALPAITHSVMTAPRVVWGGGLLLAVAVAGGVWYVQSSHGDAKPAVAVVAPVPVLSAPVVAVHLAPAVVAAASVPVAASSGSQELSTEANDSPGLIASKSIAIQKLDTVKKGATLPLVKVAPVAAAGTEPAGGTQLLRMDTVLSKKEPTPGPAEAPAAEGRSVSETLAQAQSMWNAGSRAAAMELLQQALSQVEASNPVALPVTGQSALARLAREWARMALAEGQVGQALALLTRLEPQLSLIADVWAMRGNAQQRLGQHADAVKSYKQALLLKPDEPRWMAGEAVSLAAQGQIAVAGELVEKARALGALRPEVAAYLRQLGVAVRSD